MDSLLRDRISLVACVGCGVAFGVSGVYAFYRTNQSNRHFREQITTLNRTIDQLKREVDDLRVASRAASQLNSPLNSQFYNLENSISLINSRAEYNSVSTDDNEEYYDFNEEEHDSESSKSMNHQNESDVHLATQSGNNSLLTVDKEMTLEDWLTQYDALLDDISLDKQQLYDQIKLARIKYGNCADILWRQSKATHLLSIAAQKQGNMELKKKLAFETLEYARKAIESEQNNAECHKWYAIAIGSISDYIPTKDKIANGHDFKKHVDLALKLKPWDPSIHHMLGRFCFEVSNLSWVERKVASALFSNVPESSYQDSLNNLLKAYEIKPEWKENILFIAKIYLSQKNYRDALEWLDKGISLRCVGEDDVIAHQELVSLHSKYNKYRLK